MNIDEIVDNVVKGKTVELEAKFEGSFKKKAAVETLWRNLRKLDSSHLSVVCRYMPVTPEWKSKFGWKLTATIARIGEVVDDGILNTLRGLLSKIARAAESATVIYTDPQP